MRTLSSILELLGFAALIAGASLIGLLAAGVVGAVACGLLVLGVLLVVSSLALDQSQVEVAKRVKQRKS